MPRELATLVLALLLALTPAAPAAAGKGGRAKAPAPVAEIYSAYDPGQDPDADQSSTFLEPELLESLAPKIVPAGKAAPVLPAAKRVTQLPSGVKPPPKVAVKPAPVFRAAPAAEAVASPPARAKAKVSAPAVSTARAPAPEPNLVSLQTAVANARYLSPASHRLMPVREYLTQSCEAWRGIKDYALANGAAADCVTLRHAFAFAYADEWEAGLARALQASRLTGLPAGVALVIERGADLSFVDELVRYRGRHGLRFEIKKVMLPEVSDLLTL